MAGNFDGDAFSEGLPAVKDSAKILDTELPVGDAAEILLPPVCSTRHARLIGSPPSKLPRCLETSLDEVQCCLVGQVNFQATKRTRPIITDKSAQEYVTLGGKCLEVNLSAAFHHHKAVDSPFTGSVDRASRSADAVFTSANARDMVP